MPAWFNSIDTAKNEKFNTVRLTIDESTNSSFNFEEVAIRKNDEAYHLFGWCVKATDLKNFKDKEWKFQPCPIYLKLTRGEKATEAEKAITMQFDGMDIDKFYTLGITIQNGRPTTAYVTGKHSTGEDLSEAEKSVYAGMFLSGTKEIEALTKISADDIKVPAGYGKGGYAKGESEAEKIAARLNFIISQLKETNKEAVINNVRDVVLYLEAEPTAAPIFDICIQLIK